MYTHKWIVLITYMNEHMYVYTEFKYS